MMDNELFAIQKKLKEIGHDPGPIDGVWGAETRRAIAAALGITAAAGGRKPGNDAVDAPWLEHARTQIGVKETAGAGSSADVVGYFKASVGRAYADSVPWCAAFVGAMLEETGYRGSGSLMARSYLEWGTQLDKPRRGAVVVFKRGNPPSGHVAFVDEITTGAIKCIGGNQSDAVTIASFSRTAVLGYRWPVA
jgi:uncharacterized protein (TIGR02594 family)